jgi:hypothetical protein
MSRKTRKELFEVARTLEAIGQMELATKIYILIEGDI